MPKLGPACLCLILLLPVLQAAPAGEGVPTYHGKTLKQWVELSRDDDPKVRLRAVVHLGLGPFNRAAVPALRAALKDKELEIRLAAIRALADIGHEAKAAVDDLVQVMKESDSTMRQRICFVLAEIGPAAVPALIEVFNDEHEKMRVRDCAMQSLAQIGPAASAAVPALIVALKDRKSRVDTTGALSRIGEPAIPALLEAMKDPEPIVQILAAQALGGMRSAAKVAVPILAEKLQHPDDGVRGAAATALADIGPDANDAVESLARALTDTEVEVRLKAASTLRAIGPAAAPAVKALATALNDKDEKVSIEASRALGRIGKAAVPTLSEALADDKTANCAAYALAFVGKPGVPVLTKVLQQSDAPLWGKIIRGFSRFLDDKDVNLGEELGFSGRECFAAIAPDAVGALLIALRDKHVSVRRAGAEGLRYFPKDGALIRPALLRAMTDEDANVRHLAVLAFARLEPIADDSVETKRALAGLAKALKDEDSDVRGSALEAIENFGADGTELAAAVKTALADRVDSVQMNAAIALWRLDPSNDLSVPALIRVVNTARANPSAAGQAAHALEIIGPGARNAIPALMIALRDEKSYVRYWAARALGKVANKDDGDVMAALGKNLLNRDHSNYACAEALGQLGPGALPLLTQGIRHPDGSIRLAAARGLVNLGAAAKPAVLDLAELLYDPDNDVRHRGTLALGAIGPGAHPAAPALTDGLRDRDKFVRREAATALGAIGSNSRAQSPLEQSLKDSDEQVRQESASALGKWGPDARSSAPALREACKDTNGEVRVKAAAALCRVMDDKKEGVELLKTLLRDKELFVRVLAAEALWDLDHSKDGLPPVLEALQVPSEAGYALLVVDKMGSAANGIVPDLLRLAKNKYGPCYHAASDALKKIDPEAAKKAGVR